MIRQKLHYFLEICFLFFIHTFFILLVPLMPLLIVFWVLSLLTLLNINSTANESPIFILCFILWALCIFFKIIIFPFMYKHKTVFPISYKLFEHIKNKPNFKIIFLISVLLIDIFPYLLTDFVNLDYLSYAKVFRILWNSFLTYLLYLPFGAGMLTSYISLLIFFRNSKNKVKIDHAGKA